MNLEQINKIDTQLQVMREEWVKASPTMKHYLEARAKQLKEKRQRLENAS